MKTIWMKDEAAHEKAAREAASVPASTVTPIADTIPTCVPRATEARTLFEKIWSKHIVAHGADDMVQLYIDRHFVADGSPRAFDLIRELNVPVTRPDLTFGSVDHYMPSDTGQVSTITNPDYKRSIAELMANSARGGIRVFGDNDPERGILHVLGPEQGLSLPGTTIVCSDSHTSTHGGMGALGLAIGSSESGHVLATQTVWIKTPKTMRVTVDGILPPNVTAKDLALAILAEIGANGAMGHVVEYAGPAVRALSIEGRLTLCNLAIESGARAALIAPDEKTFDYLAGRAYSPKGDRWEQALLQWRQLFTDADARFDREVRLDAKNLAPVITWGISPEHALPITANVPDPKDASSKAESIEWRRALAYMHLSPGQPLQEIAIDRVFIGSCTNGRIEDIRAVAALVAGQKIVVPGWIVPGSTPIKTQAEAEGLDKILMDAGFEWRHAGCSMCVGQNGDHLAPGERCVSTTNRNFIGRQGRDSYTHLASPMMAAAAALTGHLTDVREVLRLRTIQPDTTTGTDASGAAEHA